MMPKVGESVSSPEVNTGNDSSDEGLEGKIKYNSADRNHRLASNWELKPGFKNVAGEEDDEDEDDDDCLLLDSSKRSSSSRTAHSLSTANITTGSQSLESEDKKKKKIKKKEKRRKDKMKDSSNKKKKKKSKKKKNLVDDDEDNRSTVTERDEKLVNEICSLLSDALSTSKKTESFIRLLKECSDPDLIKPDEDSSSSFKLQQYSTLQSPEPSICGSSSSRISNLSALASVLPHLGPSWTHVDPPSVSPSSHVSQHPSTKSQGEKSIRGPKLLKELVMAAPQLDPISPISAATTVKFSNQNVPQLPIQHLGGEALQSKVPNTEINEFLDMKKDTLEVESPTAASEYSSPEELFLALPVEFRTYLLELHAEELHNSMVNQVETPNEIFPYATERLNTPTETVELRDTCSIVSDLSGFTGTASHASRSTFAPPTSLLGAIRDDSSDTSDDSDDESSEGTPPTEWNPPQVNFHGRQPRRSSLANSVNNLSFSTEKFQKVVSFDVVCIREFNTVLDYNPAVTEGPAISLGWNILHESKRMLSDQDDQRHRRHGDALILSTHTREGILTKMGYTKVDIEKAVRRITKAQQERRRTAQSVRVKNLEYAMERVGKSFRSLLRVGGSRKSN